jgi:hypothetical protein
VLVSNAFDTSNTVRPAFDASGFSADRVVFRSVTATGAVAAFGRFRRVVSVARCAGTSVTSPLVTAGTVSASSSKMRVRTVNPACRSDWTYNCCITRSRV